MKKKKSHVEWLAELSSTKYYIYGLSLHLRNTCIWHGKMRHGRHRNYVPSRELEAF